MKRLEIRVCRRDDLRALEWDGLFTHHREIVENTYRDHVEGRQVMLVGEIDGAPLAQAWVDLTRRAARRAGFVWAMRVHPRLQGCGIGQRVMAAAERAIADRGLEASELVVESENHRARRFYERLGYASVGAASETYSYSTPDGQEVEHHLHLVEMRKELAGS
jgi:ribosomal protein S18 acetylase RimI-like enzyme